MDGKVSRVWMTGPLTAYTSGFAAELKRVGYKENPVTTRCD